MKCIPDKENRFAYYISGIHMADIVFGQDRIQHSKLNTSTGQWSPEDALDPQDRSYEIPLYEINKNLKEMNEYDWDGNDSARFPWGHVYHRYTGVKTNGREAWIWAQREARFPLDIIVENNRVIGFIYTKRDGCTIMVKPGYEDLTPLKEWKDPMLSDACHCIKHIGKHMVKMRDGINLATEVWLPAGLPMDAKVPAILVRTPYGRFRFGAVELRFVQRGYALVTQDTRGREDSEGKWIPMVHEMSDGDDTLNWIAAQPWSDGKVGMIGGSYGGFVQWAAAASGNPHLKAIISLVTAGSPFVDIPRKGGTVVSGMLAWAFMMADKTMNTDAMVRDDWDKVLKIRPIKNIPQKTLGKPIEFWDEWMKHPNYDEFWERSDWTLHGDRIDVPALIISGWYDDDGMGTTEAWEMNQNNNRDNQRLILGPWYHQANSTRDIHNVPFGDNAIRYDLDLLYLRWFDRFLKKMDNGVERESRVQYYMVGSNQWMESDKWPPEEVEYTDLYLHSGGKAVSSAGNGTLGTNIPGKEPVDIYRFDPEDSAPYLIDVSENEFSVPENYRDVEKRSDVLVYTSEPLTDDLAIAGDVFAVLYASSSARDTDWVVRLTDVDEEGNSIRLSDGILRARFRNSFKKPEFLTPGKVEKYQIKMTKIANVFKKGHRIRVQVTSGAKNLAFPNHNTGSDPALDTGFVTAEQTIYHDAVFPSHIKLPVLRGNLSNR
ncbi:MAG: putative esterase [Firmicutes bacterium]|nr:putative esterase [Bacillota bacterium]